MVAPIADSGGDQTVQAYDLVTLDGSGSSDPDGTVTGYAWRQISGAPVVTLSSTAAIRPTFKAPGSDVGSILVFGLIVTDNTAAQSTESTVTINVNAASWYAAKSGGWTAVEMDAARSTGWDPAPVLPGAPTSVSAVAGNTQATVSFTGPGGSVDSYRVTSTPSGIVATGSASPLTVSGLTNGQPYTFTVAAHNSVGWGPESAATSPPVTPAGAPARPAAPTAVAGDAAAVVSFVVLGGTVDNYRITSAPGAIVVTSTGSPVTVTGLTNNTAYTFTLAAHNSVGWSVDSLPSSPAVTPMGLPGKPATPSASAGDARATVTFSSPGGPVDSYRVTSVPVSTTVTGTVSPITVTSLTNGQAYTFKVAAHNPVGWGPDSDASSPVTPTAPVGGNPITTSFTAIAKSATEIPNAERGEYSWIQVAIDPAGWPYRDVYYRDNIGGWKNVETSQGVYNYTTLDAGCAAAAAAGGKFGFRIVAFSPDFGGDETPAYVPRQSTSYGGQQLPDYNSNGFLTAWENLWAALGARYNNDNRVGWVDIGGYGDWGEWHIAITGGAAVTTASMQRIISAVANNMSNKYVFAMTATASLLQTAMSTRANIGWRADCLGSPGFMGSQVDSVPDALARWQTAPVATEWCNVTGGEATGLAQVSSYHISLLSSGNFPVRYASKTGQQQADFANANKNSGYRYQLNSAIMYDRVTRGTAFNFSHTWQNVNVAPTYLPWQINLQLRNTGTGALVWSGVSAYSLKTLLPGTHTAVDSLTVPGTVAAGTYLATVAVVDPAAYLAPMQLAVNGRRADGSYPLNNVVVS